MVSPIDPLLLPTPFLADETWAVCLRDPRSGQLQEGLVLADASMEGLAAIRRAYPDGSAFPVAMAFSLAHLRQLNQALGESEASDGALQASALQADRAWPAWASDGQGSFLTWFAHDGQHADTRWVRAGNRGAALLALAQAEPGAQLLGVGDLGQFERELARLERVVADQDFGQVWTDLRRVDRPATRAHIAAYPLARQGMFPSPEAAMAAHQALFLDALADEPLSE